MTVPMLRARILRRHQRRDLWSGLPVLSTVTAVGDHRIHSLEFGEHEQSIVLIHGLAGSAQWWNRNVQELCSEYRVVIPDLIGFGQTQRTGYVPDMPRVAQVLCAWMNQLDLGRVHLVGHSMGGQIAIHLAARFPDRIDCLVLVDSAGVPRRLTPRAMTRFALQMAPPRAWGNLRFLRTIAGDAWTAGPRTLAQATFQILLDDVRPLLPQIEAPTLILWGERDRLVPLEDAEVLRSRIPHAQLLVLRGAAHNPMVDQPGEFNQAVLSFLRGEAVGW
jgi:pimeloyl-ACP methyl ester carboxylesterase